MVRKRGAKRKVQHFKSKESYRKAEAYRHIHHVEHNPNKPYPKVEIAGHKHKVEHSED